MPFEFDDEQKSSAGSFVFDDEQTVKKKAAKGKPGFIADVARNTAPWLAEGVNNILGAVPDLVAPDSGVAQFFGDNADFWRDKQSESLKARQAAADQRISQAGEDGVLSQIGAAADEYTDDPALAARLAVTNIPSFIPGLALGKAAQVAGAARGLSLAQQAALATGVSGGTNAALNAGGARGDAYDDIRKTLIAKGVAPQDATDMALQGSKLPAAVGAVTGFVSGKTGLEKSLLGQATVGSAFKQGAKAIGAELGGELVEEVTPKLTTNMAVQEVDPTRQITQDVGRTIVDTAVGAGPTSVAAGVSTGIRTLADSAPAPAVAPAAQGGGAVNASEILGTPAARTDAAPLATNDTAENEKALRTPVGLTTLDRVTEIDAALAASPADAPESDALRTERQSLTKDWPTAIPGNGTAFSTESGSKLEGQYALIDADELVTSHDSNLRANPAYPQELQPRERDRAASELQVSGIVQRLDPARLGISADSATGAPIVGADGLVESGNARTIALKRVYQASNGRGDDARGSKAHSYREFLRDNAAQFGITPESVDSMAKPVLVRVRSTPVNRAEFARQANAPTVAQMSPSEQAKADSKRIESMDDLSPDDNGDFGTSRDFIRRFMARLPGTEQGGMIDADGKLSTTGYARISNAVLAKAYGDSPVLARMVESRDDNLRNVSKALLVAAPTVAKMRQSIGQGTSFDADITPDLMAAVEELSRLKDSGTSVADALAQAGMFGDKFSPETKMLLQFLADNIRRPRRMADFIVAYMDALDAAGDPNQGSLLGDVQPPAKGDLLTAAKEGIEGNGSQNTSGNTAQDSQRGNPGEGAPTGQPDRGQSQDAQGNRGGNEGDGAAGADASGETRLSRTPVEKSEWVNFPKESGTIGIPRADMPQIKSEHRGALLGFLKARGIDNRTDEDVPASKFKPTQAEFSIKKTARWTEVRDGSDRSVLVSSDGHILDGHHQWMAAVSSNEPVKAIVLDAPIRELLANVFQFPSVQQSGESAKAKADGTKARDDFKAAMADLADLMADKLGARVMMMPPNNAELRKILVRLFVSAIDVVGTDLKAATKWVKDKLKANSETKGYWNKITEKDYQGAALEAMEAGAKAHVDDLFAKAEKAQAGLFDEAPQAPATAMINGRPYDYAEKTGDNFKIPEPALFLSADVLAAADAFVKKYYIKATHPMTQAERDVAEKLLAPNIELAKAAKVEYDQKIIDIASRTKALGQLLAPVKGIKRGAEKMWDDAAKRGRGMEAKDVRDLLRSTIVVNAYSDVAKVVESIRNEFQVVEEKDKTSESMRQKQGGYADYTVFVKMPNGVLAEIQINIPTMLAAKDNQGHKLYEAARSLPDDSGLKAEITDAMSVIYLAAFSSFDLFKQATKASSLTSAPTRGPDSPMPGKAIKDLPSPDASNQPLSGMDTYSSPEKPNTKREPSGNLSGTFIAKPFTDNVSQLSKNGYDTPDLFGDSDGNTTSGQGGADGQGAGVAQATAGKRKAGRVPGGQGAGNIFGDSLDDTSPTNEGQVGQPGTGGVRASDEVGGKPESGKGAGRNVGVPAGRDIPAKSGRNYEFGPDDLTYEGSWPVKAEQNVKAVELVKLLEAEGRQATRDEQKILAKFIGWGSGELANNLFGPKLDKSVAALSGYNDAVAAMGKLGRDYLQKGGQYRGQYADNGYYDALTVMRTAGKVNQYDMPQRITRAELDSAKPDASTQRWIALRDRLKAAMTKQEYEEASRSTQYAHFTSKGIVTLMWSALRRLGFNGGHMLEPGAGIGVFAGLMPTDMALNSSYTGIEFDSITGAILKQLFPDERILVESFVDTKLPKNFYDVSVGNPPFSGTKILGDPEYAKQSFSLHDYFFAKSIDRTKPGGLVVFVTSRYTMDKLSDKARGYLADRADLVGAIRLPQTAFKQNAGTDVVTDVIFLRKKVKGEKFEHAKAWGKSVPMQVGSKSFPVNEYFHAHPEMVLGTPSDTGKMQNSPEPQYTVLAPTGDIEALFAKAVENLPENIYQAERGSSAEAAKVREIDFNPKAKKEGNFYVTDAGVLMQREGGVGQRVDLKNAKDAALVKDFVPLRDALKQAHYDQLSDGEWETSLKALQKAYADFTKKNGQINQFVAKTVNVKVDELDDDGNPTGRKVDDEEVRRKFTILEKLKDDPDWTLVAALENLNEDTGVITPSAFLEKRVLVKRQAAAASTPIDAMLMTLNDIGRIDMPVIAQRVGLTEAQTIEALGTSVYNDPEAGWVTADDYLSGNVKDKLEVARAAAKGDRNYERNITALEANQPDPLNPSQIDPRMGMNWIPADVYEEFVSEITNGRVEAKVNFDARTKHWTVQEVRGGTSEAATSEWGTPHKSMVELMDYAVTGRPIRVNTKPAKGEALTFDEAATEAAKEKLEALHTKFSSWVFSEPVRTDKLVRIYNDKFNTTKARQYDGSHLTLPGASTQFNIFNHVKRGAWRIIQSGNTYLAHAVGSGKTFQMVISAMEQKRLGLIQKPMIVVPNHMLKQFAHEWQQLYPAARLMVADEHNFHSDNRRRFVSRVALSDLDGVVITHSAFKLLDLDPEFKKGLIKEQLDFFRAALEEAGGDPDKLTITEETDTKTGKVKVSMKGSGSRDPKIKRIEKQIENMEQKLLEATSSVGKDANVRFDELGVDMLYVDEAHEFRKLDFTTKREVKGISPVGSGRAFDLYMKSRYLESKNPGRSLVLASGTPVTNTIAELYTVQKLLGYQALVDKGLEDFDSWASMFGREKASLEPNAAGKYEVVSRFQEFANVPELTQMFREFADVLTSDQLADMLGDERPKVEGGARSIIITPETAEYEDFRSELEERMVASKAWKPSADEPNNPDPVIRIIGDGRLAAIDMRFMNPALPNNPDSKLNRLADDVIAAFKETADVQYRGKEKKDENDKKIPDSGDLEPSKGSSMMVFSDLGFGAGVAQTRGFNARAWFEKRLRDAGVPMDQVAFMGDYKKSSAKLKLFSDLNAGRMRILVGSSKNMGTGVNAQQRLKNLFHLDSPWYPADLEQREGRIIRTGNKNREVRIKAYATKGTYDQQMWGQLANKQMFIDKAMSGDPSVRKIEDAGAADLMSMVAGMVAKDPRVLQLAGINAEIGKLQRLYQAHEDNRATYRGRFNEAKFTAEWNQSRLADAKAVAGQAKDLSGENFKAKVGGSAFTERVKWAEALIAKYKDLSDRATTQVQKVGEISGFEIAYGGETLAGQYRTKLMLATPNPIELVTDAGTSAMGVAMRAQNAVVDVARLPAKIQERITQAMAAMDGLSTKIEAQFPMLGMLSDKVRERDALIAEMAAPTPAEADTEDAGETQLSRGPGGSMAVAELTTVVNRIKAKMPKMTTVHVLADPSKAPKELQDYIRKQNAWADVEGAMHKGELYMFASGLSSALRAEHVLAEHEAAHLGLRAVLGDKLNSTMQAIWVQNAEVRRAAAELQKRGKLSNAEAVEEVIVDIPTERLARLKGWRALAMKVRDHLMAMGFDAMAEKLTRFLTGTLSYQQRADLMVADLVRAARGYVAGKVPGNPAFAQSSSMLASSMAEDAAKQEQWLQSEANARGYKDIDTLAEENYPLFEKLAELWRKKNPADNGVLLSRRFMALVSGQSELDAAIKEAGKGLQKAIDDKKGAARVMLGRSPHVLSAALGGALANPLPMVVEPGILNKTVSPLGTQTSKDAGKHYGDLEGVSGEDLARAMYRPAAVVDDPSQAGNYNIVTNILTPRGPLVVNVNTLGTAVVNGQPQPVVFINSIYARELGEVGLWLNGKEYNAKKQIIDSRRSFLYIDQAQIGEAVSGKLNPENKNPAFAGRDLLGAKGAVNTSPVVPQTALSPISPNTSIISKYGSPASGNYRGLASVDAGLQRWVTGKGLKPGSKPAKTYGNLLAWIDKHYKGENAADKPMFSLAPAQKTAGERADTIISTKAASRAPLDTLVRGLTRVTGVEKVLGAVYGRAAVLLDRYTPETVKAGIVSDYGVPQAVIDKRSAMQGNQRQQLRGAGTLLEKLATLTREESRIAYEWMNLDGSDPRAYVSMMQGLPEESVKTLTEVQKLIDELSQEAMRLGQLSPEAYKRNRMAYLRRSYVKHTMELTKGEVGKRARVISILGDQYKGRGMTDSAAMQSIQNTAPDWWKRKLQAGKADASLKNEKFVRLERRAASGEGVKPLDGMEGKSIGKLLEVNYYPAGEALPAKYKDWNKAGEWEVRDVKGGNLVMWRDFTKDEREKMGEIDEARYAIAKTLHAMIHDVEVGRYLEWLGQTYAKKEGESIPGVVVDASERYLDTFKEGEWVKVPDSKISGTSVTKYGKLAGQYIPGPIWNDLRQVVNGQFQPLGETYSNILRVWKTSKTALSPAVHTNNIMSNLVMADWHDVTAGHMAKALRIIMAASKGSDRGGLGGMALRTGSKIGLADTEAAKEVLNRYRDSGGDIGGWVTNEIRDEQLKPLLDALEKELAVTQGQSVQAQVGVFSALQHAMMLRFPSAWDAFKGGKNSGKVAGAITTEAGNLLDLYQSEDDVFRLAAWLRAKEEGKADLEAGKTARESFLDYRINAPWIAAMRATAWPFVSFSYRAIPMFLEIAAKKPHKLMKLMMLAGAVNALGVLLSGGDDEKERKLLPEEKAGKIWGMVPKLVRMPWNDSHGSAVYLDIRRFIPVGDVFDVGAGNSAVPLLPSLTPGGPMVLMAEVVLNKSAFTGKPISLETDTAGQQATKVVDYLYKAFAPNLLGLPGTYATTGVADSMAGRTDAFGREMSTPQALASSFGIKLGSYPADVLRKNLQGAAQAQLMEIDKNITQLKRQRQTNRIDQAEFDKSVQVEQEKKAKVMQELAKKM